ncbi:Rho1 guanine nucleotide exchange factor 1 [Penicillium diatomitis]|uniref:Rho1 guanine nucleotide exchange factor 1 n=1 Tax=Penicillium diatomitis TaxID=2819901 RepID=A0A9W9XL22_9EURO|nr:Rho1 guanine nucleotide exchange factor 1 [Penicillium diatomitis]KAJ5494972.1 Rho1 guanine nucleotide exchange factor 1 [Penicillium diatomitis]
MADLGGQRNRNYRPYGNGPASSVQRDAAYNDIFGSAPPPGRSQTMNSQTPQFNQGRAHTMSSQVVHPQFQRPPPPPTRQSMANGYGQPQPAPHNGYSPAPPQAKYQAYTPAIGSASPQPSAARQYPGPPGRFAYPRPQRLDSRPVPPPQYPDSRDLGRPMPPPL